MLLQRKQVFQYSSVVGLGGLQAGLCVQAVCGTGAVWLDEGESQYVSLAFCGIQSAFNIYPAGMRALQRQLKEDRIICSEE